MTRILLADDHAAIRAGVRLILETASPPCQVVAEASTAAEAVTLARQQQPDVVLLDVRMPGGSGLGVISTLRETGAAVMMLTSFALDEYVMAALEAGADGFLVKSAEPQDIVQAVRDVANGDAALSPEVLRSVIRRAVGRPDTLATPDQHSTSGVDSPPAPDSGGAAAASSSDSALSGTHPGQPGHHAAEAPDLIDPLTPREQDVLRLLAEGYSNHHIAQELVVSESTVKTHVSHVLAKLQVTSRVQAALWWGRYGAGR
ncbi:response regulator [Kocuria sp.]|uniref:response regulator n=1 Tax=Kocuria sp. TaxID=1871328 RepID=UPI0026DF3EF8|nr:response regulator transcription factor [Kocuria sp.]MDO5619108.1 response regulator transcription factor [Kocuria sp.]